MEITVKKELDTKQEIIILGLWEEDTHNYRSFDHCLAEELADAVKKKLFSKKFGEKFSTKIKGKRVYVYGLGKKKEFTLEHLRRIMGKAVRCVKSKQVRSFSTNIANLCSLNDEQCGRGAAEAMILADYNFLKYCGKEKREKQKEISSVSLQWTKSAAGLNKGLDTGKAIAEAANYVRDLVNEPASVCNSLYMEKEAKKLAGSKVKIKVLNLKEMKKLGMGSLLGVNAGSDNPPKLVFLEYNGGKGSPTAIVGKGITFDSGGYNLKPTKYIEEMKTDMAGAAAVLGVIRVAALLGIKKNLVGVMPLCENMVNGSAQRPGDIVKAYNGKTIEIGNTDAEGRLVLADAISYTEKKYKPEVIVDMATLTGSCVVALGYYAAGLIGKDKKLLSRLAKAGEESGDKVWELPFYDEFQDWMDGNITDLNNISMKGRGYEAGTITAGVFLSKFVEKAKWAHLDIAGSAYWAVDGDYLSKGATGSGVRLLSYYLLNG